MIACKTLALPFVRAKVSKTNGFDLVFFPSLRSRVRGNKPSSRFYSFCAADAGDESTEDTVEKLLTEGDVIRGLMKMERKSEPEEAGGRWFPYLDICRVGSESLTSREVVKVLGPYILDPRKERIQRVVDNRSYSVSLVVEGLTDFGNVSAAFRSADALGIQSVHVISSDVRKRCNHN